MNRISLVCFYFTTFVSVFISLQAIATDWSNKKPLLMSEQIYHNKSLSFIPHEGQGKFDNYVAMTVNYHAVKPLFLQLEQRLNRQLKHRGEAHITVVTPVEYHQVLKPFLSMKTINTIAKDIQHAAFEVVCLGQFETKIKQLKQQTYYVVVKSDELLALRKRILQAFVDAGGKTKDFNVAAFYPHITVGFSARDLHLSDGAKKDKRSCAYPIRVQ